MRSKEQDVIAGGILLLLAVPGLLYSYQIKNLTVSQLSGGFFPGLCFMVMAICGLVLIRAGLRREVKIPIPALNWPKLLPVVGVLVGYVLLMKYLGFVVSTVIFMASALYVFGERRKKIFLIVPVTTSVAVYYLFSKAFMIILPGLPDFTDFP